MEWRRRHGSEGDSDVDRSVLEEAGEEVSGPVGRSGKGSGPEGKEKREGEWAAACLLIFSSFAFFFKGFPEKERKRRKENKIKGKIYFYHKNVLTRYIL